MSQPITTSVTMDAESFQKFRSFDLFHHQKRWQRPLLFAAILLGSSGASACRRWEYGRGLPCWQ